MANTKKAAPDLQDEVASFLAERMSQTSRVAVGYSGGLDSTVLLHLLVQSRDRIGSLSAVHVHHGLSPHADDWVGHCRQVCQALDVPLEVVPVRVELDGEGLEAAARAARYRVFCQLAVDCIALAHHRDDQAETVLMHLLRGTSLKGLAAMPAARRLRNSRILLVRPLLQFARTDLERYARLAGLAWVEDESNRDVRYTRNAIRHALLPGLEGRSPGIGAALAQAAGQFAECAALMDDLAQLDGAGAFDQNGFAIERLHALPEARARNLLRQGLEARGGVIRRDALHEALRQLLRARWDALLRVDFGPVSLRRFQDRVRIVQRESTETDEVLNWRGEEEMDLGPAGQLRFQPMVGQGVRLEGAATVRWRQGGERLQPDRNRPSRTLKNLLREAGIPPWVRPHLPLVYAGDRLAWVAEIGTDAGFQVGPDEPGWIISWRRPEQRVR